jgi:hypothetical protein
MLDKIQGLNDDLNNNSSIEFDLNGYISKFIKIINTGYNDTNKNVTDKIEYLKEIDKLNEYEKKDMEQFLENYHDSLKGAIEITTKLKPTELVKNDVVIGDINNTQPNSAPDETELPVKNELDKFNGTFGQKQEALGCGRHALNNLLGHAYFTGFKPGMDDIPYTLDELKDISDKQLNLHKLCKYLTIRESNTTGMSENKSNTIGMSDNESNTTDMSENESNTTDMSENESNTTDMSEDEPCPADENYNITVLIIALGLIGFEINKTFQFKNDNSNKDNAPNIDDTDVFGLLININQKHWVSARKYKETIYYMDSSKENKVTEIIKYDDLNNIIIDKENTTYTIINTGERKKVFIHLKIDDFIAQNVDSSAKQIFYNNLYSNYIHDLKDEETINKLYNNQFQYSQELTSIIQNETKNVEEILKLLLGEPNIVKTTDDPLKNNTILAARNKINNTILAARNKINNTILATRNKINNSQKQSQKKQSQKNKSQKNKSQKKEVKDLNWL